MISVANSRTLINNN